MEICFLTWQSKALCHGQNSWSWLDQPKKFKFHLSFWWGVGNRAVWLVDTLSGILCWCKCVVSLHSLASFTRHCIHPLTLQVLNLLTSTDANWHIFNQISQNGWIHHFLFNPLNAHQLVTTCKNFKFSTVWLIKKSLLINNYWSQVQSIKKIF